MGGCLWGYEVFSFAINLAHESQVQHFWQEDLRGVWLFLVGLLWRLMALGHLQIPVRANLIGVHCCCHCPLSPVPWHQPPNPCWRRHAGRQDVPTRASARNAIAGNAWRTARLAEAAVTLFYLIISLIWSSLWLLSSPVISNYSFDYYMRLFIHTLSIIWLLSFCYW